MGQMKTPTGRRPLFERLKTMGMEQAIRHSKGEIDLKTTVIELPDPPPVIQAEEVARLRLDHEMSRPSSPACSMYRPKLCRAGNKARGSLRVRPFD